MIQIHFGQRYIPLSNCAKSRNPLSISFDKNLINHLLVQKCRLLQDDQLNMTVFFRYLVKSVLFSVRHSTRVHWISHFLQGTRKTRPCLTGHPVRYGKTSKLFSYYTAGVIMPPPLPGPVDRKFLYPCQTVKSRQTYLLVHWDLFCAIFSTIYQTFSKYISLIF